MQQAFALLGRHRNALQFLARAAELRDPLFPLRTELLFEFLAQALRERGTQAARGNRDLQFTAAYDGFLPRFRGPEGSAGQMVREYPGIVHALAPLATAVTELRLSARGAWNVDLDSGLTLALGRGDLEPRLQRFVAAWPTLVAQGVEARRIDLRYTNGFAVQTTKIANR